MLAVGLLAVPYTRVPTDSVLSPVLSDGVLLQHPEPGDIVAVPVTGAYCFTMSNNYNGALRPPVVFVSHGQARVVVRRETYSDLIVRDVAN